MESGDIASEILRHTQGATVKHAGVFATLEVPVLPLESVRHLYKEYVTPFYMRNLHQFGAEEEAAFRRIRSSITDELIVTLLSDFNWRSRTTATYFAMILDRKEHLDHIGRLLLRSDVCFAGLVYCRYLAQIRTPEAIDFLNRYLAYYLVQPQLYFDQPEAVAALRHIDRLSGSKHESSHSSALAFMTAARPDFLTHVSAKSLKADLRAVDRLRSLPN